MSATQVFAIMAVTFAILSTRDDSLISALYALFACLSLILVTLSVRRWSE